MVVALKRRDDKLEGIAGSGTGTKRIVAAIAPRSPADVIEKSGRGKKGSSLFNKLSDSFLAGGGCV